MVWPTINTGLPPERHQSYFSTRLVEGSYHLRARRIDDVKGAPFWSDLASRGRRIVLVDVPFSQVDAAFGGRQIVGWGQHDWDGRCGSHPAGLLESMQRQFGRYPVTPTVDDVWFQGGPDALLERLLLGIQRRTQMLCHLARPRDWDFFYAVFHEAHGAGHQFWHLSDASHPRFDSTWRSRNADPLLAVYEALDRALAEVIAALGPDSSVVLVLSHGMGPNYNGDHLFPELLARFNAGYELSPAVAPLRTASQRAWHATMAHLPMSLRLGVQRQLPLGARRWFNAKRRQQGSLWRNAPAFALPGLDGFSAVRVNLRGREPAGKVSPGGQCAEYLTTLEAEIGTWTVGTTGQSAVARIHRAPRGRELHLGVAPDLMLWWSKAGPIELIRSPRLGEVAGTSADRRTGEHVMHSLLLLRQSATSCTPIDLAGVDHRDVRLVVRALAKAT
jgi:predicted AlkP superfamily phosphohydrolase/phosphomutase